MSTISVLIPVYNVESYLARCIESVLRQDFQDWEMILVDDGSPDNSGAICDEYAKKDARIKVVHKENGGLVSARREGFLRSTGKYLVFLDSDDTLAEGALSVLYNHIVQGYDVVKGRVVRLKDEGQVLRVESCKFTKGIIVGEENVVVKIFSGEVLPYLCGSIYSRHLFSVDVFNRSIDAKISFGEDWITNLLVSKNVKRMLCMEDVIYNYYVNEDSITSSQVSNFEYIGRVATILRNEKFMDKPYLQEYIVRWYCSNYINRFFIPEIGFRYKEYMEVKKYLKEYNKLILKDYVNPRYLFFFDALPLYYIYTKIYCAIFLIFKLHGTRRRILK